MTYGEGVRVHLHNVRRKFDENLSVGSSSNVKS